jgi:hypothetical protein
MSATIQKDIHVKEDARTPLEITSVDVHSVCMVMVKQVVKDLLSSH